MLEVSTLPSPSSSSSKEDQLLRGIVGNYVFPTGDDCFMVDDDVSLLDYIDFSSCGVVPSLFDADGDILPDLEVDPTDEFLAEFSSSPEQDPAVSPPTDGANRALGGPEDAKEEEQKQELLVEDERDDQKRLLEDVIKNNGDDQVVSSAVTTEEDSSAAGSDGSKSSASAEGHSKKKASAGKNSHGKRKVDWTPELHRRFVQAVEQLGIDKAVPSRILEIMGIKCLTRHNIASHLQKYRSHRKHLMAREAEAASWAQKRQMYAVAASSRKDLLPGPWAVPTVGFPPPGFVRPPLHVWGHPPPPTAVEASMLPTVWPRHLAPPRPLPPWAHPPPVDPAAAYWYQQYNAATKWPPQAVTQGTPCVPPPIPPPAAMLQRPGTMMVPHPSMYGPPAMIPPLPPHTATKQLAAGLQQLQLDTQPSKESIDAAIGDVLVKPWLPLPLGLKPPSLDSVMSELHKQGIPKVPPGGS